MIVNPYTQTLEAYPNSRLLKSTFGVVGKTVQDTEGRNRVWTITALFAPLPKRALGGLRAKLIDQDNFITFINQRDLEVLLGARPGTYCVWLKDNYVGPQHRDWCGVGVDEDDLLDDLHEYELFLRAKHNGRLPHNQEYTRKVHKDDSVEVEELYTSLWDSDRATGMSPDTRIDTVGQRWSRVEVRRL